MKAHLDQTLLLFPCCASKEKVALPPNFTPAPHLRKGLPTTKKLLKITRKEVKKAFPDAFPGDFSWPALFLYNGHQYKVSGFRRRVLKALKRDGFHCCILSGGFGLVDALESVPNYNLSMQKSAKFWRKVLPVLLKEYIKVKRIKYVYVAGSASYLTVLNDPTWRKNVTVFKYVPELKPGEGGALTKVPKMVGKAVATFLKKRKLSPGWKRW